MDAPIRAAVWLNENQIPLAAEVARRAGLSLALAGGPERGRSPAIATALDAQPADDLRQLLHEAQVDLIWLLAAGDFGSDQGGTDTAALLAAHKRGVRIASLDPVPASAIEIAQARWKQQAGTGLVHDIIRLCPLDRYSRSHRDAADLLDMFGPPSVLSIDSICSPTEGSLGGRLLSAIDLVHAWLGEPEAVNAVFTPPASNAAIITAPGDDLRNLRGSISAAIRFVDGRGATILVSDQSNDWHRDVTLIGPKGRLQISETVARWSGEPETATTHKPTQPVDAAEAQAWSLKRLFDPALPPERPIDLPSLLATAQTILLSARTGQAEAIATVRRMAGVA